MTATVLFGAAWKHRAVQKAQREIGDTKLVGSHDHSLCQWKFAQKDARSMASCRRVILELLRLGDIFSWTTIQK